MGEGARGRRGRGRRSHRLLHRLLQHEDQGEHYPMYLLPGGPMLDRRTFVRSLAVTAPAFSPKAIRYLLQAESGGAGAGGPDDEDYWAQIQRSFDCDRT